MRIILIINIFSFILIICGFYGVLHCKKSWVAFHGVVINKNIQNLFYKINLIKEITFMFYKIMNLLYFFLLNLRLLQLFLVQH